MSEHGAASLRREISKVPRGPGLWFPQSLRDRVVEWALARRESTGESWETIGLELGIAGESVRRWCARSDKAAPRMRRVEIVSDDRAEPAVSIVSPTGYRVEGLSLAAAAAMLRMLG